MHNLLKLLLFSAMLPMFFSLQLHSKKSEMIPTKEYKLPTSAPYFAKSLELKRAHFFNRTSSFQKKYSQSNKMFSFRGIESSPFTRSRSSLFSKIMNTEQHRWQRKKNHLTGSSNPWEEKRSSVLSDSNRTARGWDRRLKSKPYRGKEMLKIKHEMDRLEKKLGQQKSAENITLGVGDVRDLLNKGPQKLPLR